MQNNKAKITLRDNGEVVASNRTAFAKHFGIRRAELPAKLGEWMYNAAYGGIVEIRACGIFTAGVRKAVASERWLEAFAAANKNKETE